MIVTRKLKSCVPMVASTCRWQLGFGFVILLVICNSCVVEFGHAAELNFKKGVVSGLDYTRRQNSVGDAEESTESVATVAPFISIYATSRRSFASVNARLIGRGSSESGQSEVQPRLAATSSIYSESQRLRFDAAASVVQRTVDSPFLQDETISTASSRERVVSVSAGPSYDKQFGSTKIETSYKIGAISASETDDSRSVVQAVSFNLERQTSVQDLAIGTRINSQHTAFESASSASSSSLFVYADYEFQRNLFGRVLVGRDFVDVNNDSFINDANVAGVGMVWQPGRRLKIEASYLERYFGRQPKILMGIDGRRSSIALSWSRDVGISGAFEQAIVGVGGGTPIDSSATELSADDVELDSAGVSPLILFQESQKVNEIVTLGYTIRGRVSTFNTSVSTVHQEDLLTAENARSNLLEMSLSRKISLSSTGSIRLARGETHRDNDESDMRTEDSIRRIGLRWNVVF